MKKCQIVHALLAMPAGSFGMAALLTGNWFGAVLVGMACVIVWIGEQEDW